MKTLLALLIFCLLLCATSAGANTWRPEERLMDALSQIESSGGRFVYGDDGASLGPFQIQKPAWADVVAWRKKRGLPTHDYNENVFNSRISRIYAADYLTILHGRLKAQYHREPTPGELYAAYNMGMSNFRKCNYDLRQVNKVTGRKCQELTAMLK